MLPGCSLQALSSSVSDHCPLLMVGKREIARYQGFRFEVFWPKVQGYSEVVQSAWDQELSVINPFLRLHTKLQRTGKALRSWSRSKIGHVKLLLCAAKQLIAILDVVQEFRQLTGQEIQFRRDLKARVFGLSAVEKIRAKQQSRLSEIKAADANSRLFFLRINGRQRKNFIQQLYTDSGVLIGHKEKENLIFEHYSKLFGTTEQRQYTLDWELLGMQSHDLQSLEEEFSEEVFSVVHDIASDKAPGPDGFIGAFFKASWQIIKHDLMAAINFFYNQHDQHFKQLNSAHIILIPKKREAKSLGDYRPISLSHSIAKLVSKLLANRLVPFFWKS